ncbi:putative NADPH dehydrogenase C23G7.10c [Grifola frondosa]|uniref:Putative NADPH dehydrogenase C23G7.10c n=1 Tax=Grifola frondosa TaxID=5627 RepID=A0A1C7LUN9_GRIFR|nr:putative NADPH dehydrogenase C23G7.10c [Grifola frondosa]
MFSTSLTMIDIVCEPAPNTSYFTAAQVPAAGTIIKPRLNEKATPLLFQPIKIRGVEFHNRIVVSSPCIRVLECHVDVSFQKLSPMAQYSADYNGAVTPWHTAHRSTVAHMLNVAVGGIFTRGPGLTFVEATAVLPQGRTSPQDLGIWSDEHVEPLRKLVEFAHSQNQKIGIQLAHAGRKASTLAMWLDGNTGASANVGGWPDDVWAPSAIPYKDSPDYPKAKALSVEGIQGVVRAFADAARRAVAAGFDVIDIHAAHGYLLHQFMSPVTNKRTDQYGGSFENRIRLPLEVVDAVRAAMPADTPLFFRVSATEWLEEVAPEEPSWRLEDTVRLSEILVAHGVDLIDVSSAGLDRRQKIKFLAPAYQAHFSEAVKKAVGDRILVSAVGGIVNGQIAEEVLENGQADLVMVGRQFIKNTATVVTFAEELGVNVKLPHQIDWVVRGRGITRREQLKN